MALFEIESDEAPVIVPSKRSQSRPRNAGGPPAFTGVLQLEPCDFKALQKGLKKFKKSSNMKKLYCLDYLVTKFSEVAYFEVQSGKAGLVGVLGYGCPVLVTGIQAQLLTPELLPSLFGVLAEGECFVGPIEALGEQDRQGLISFGFQTTDVLGAFPITFKKAVTGLWIGCAQQLPDLPAKELQSLKKLFTDFVL